MTRLIVFGVALLFVLGFAVLTVDAFVEEGVTFPGVVSLLVLLLLAVGVLGGLRPRRRR